MINNMLNDKVSLDDTITIYESTFDPEENGKNFDADKQIHKWLTELKTYRTKKEFNSNKSDLSVFANLVFSSYKSIFNSAEVTMKKEKSGAFVIFMPSAIVEIDIDKEFDQIVCVISFHNNANVIVVGEMVNMIKDIFKGNVIINSDPFIVDDNTQEFIWGDKEIANYQKRLKPMRVRHSIIFSDKSAGHS